MKMHLLTVALLLTGSAALAQELEPGVQTSSSAAAVKSDAAQKDQAQKNQAQKQPVAQQSVPPATNTPATNTSAAAAKPVAAAPVKSTDRIQLDTTQISGNRELPKVMYVVPWRRADPGDFAGRPPNSLLDEALTPVDRDVFRRTNRYYGTVQDSAQSARSQAGAANAGSGAASPKDEK